MQQFTLLNISILVKKKRKKNNYLNVTPVTPCSLQFQSNYFINITHFATVPTHLH